MFNPYIFILLNQIIQMQRQHQEKQQQQENQKEEELAQRIVKECYFYC